MLKLVQIKVEMAGHRTASMCLWGELLCQGKELYLICWLCLFITQEWAEREELPPCEVFAGAAGKTALIVMEL